MIIMARFWCLVGGTQEGVGGWSFVLWVDEK